MTDYSDVALSLKAWAKRYSEAMRDKDYNDAKYCALRAARVALTCIEAARIAEATSSQSVSAKDAGLASGEDESASQ